MDALGPRHKSWLLSAPLPAPVPRPVDTESGAMTASVPLSVSGFSAPAFNQLEKLFDKGATVTVDALRDKGIVSSRTALVKVLGRGEVTKALTVQAHKFSGKAAEKLAAAGGKAEALAK